MVAFFKNVLYIHGFTPFSKSWVYYKACPGHIQVSAMNKIEATKQKGWL